MKRIIIVILLLSSFLAKAQYKTAIGIDTFPVPSTLTAYTYIISHHDSVYVWSIALQKWVMIVGTGGGGGGAWGSITGTLSSQTDLQSALNGKEASFTETTQEFTSSTSMSITLSNTPKAGKAEMYYLNGIVIKSSNVSRTGTGVTLSGFVRSSSDVITAKYSY